MSTPNRRFRRYRYRCAMRSSYSPANTASPVGRIFAPQCSARKARAWIGPSPKRSASFHDNNVERLAQLIREYPALLSWRGDFGESLLGFATESFGDSGDPDRERAFTCLECAEFLIDAGAVAHPAIWEGAIRGRAKGVLQLLSHKGVLPRNLDTATALGDHDGVLGLASGC